MSDSSEHKFLAYADALARPLMPPEEVRALIDSVATMSPADAALVLKDLDELDEVQGLQLARTSFLHFCARVYTGFKQGPHHRFLEPLLHNVCAGSELRLTVSMAPRFGKSETIAFLFVAWYLGHHPDHQIIMVTHTSDLSSAFGRKVRNLIGTADYQLVFPGTVISRDKTAADDWTTTAGGKYLAVGVGGAVAGYGAHLLICDDLVSEQAVLSNPDVAFDTAWKYMQVGPLQRLMPGGAIVMIGTRWGKRDPIGRALSWATENAESIPWNEVRFPAIMPSGKSLWPEQWPVEQLLAKKAGMQPQYWAAQYVQEPHAEEGALLKRDWWQIWQKDKPPAVHFVIQSWDTAHDTKTTNDFSACTTWGIWFNETTNRDEIILLDAVKSRWEFPQLKEKALSMYKDWEPDDLIIEKKAAGAPLIQEMRQGGIPVTEVSPSRGKAGMSNDKRARVSAVAPILADKLVWAPDRRWASEVIEECATFPFGENDDLCLVGGTLILMADGTERAIECVRVGDTVQTPLGAQRVLAAGFTGIRSVWDLRAGAHTLCSTGNHPVATTRGWCRVDTLTQADTLKQANPWSSVWRAVKKTMSLLSLWSSTDTHTTVTQKPSVLRTAGTSCAGVVGTYCTATSGNSTTGRFLTGTTSTTRTRTPSTTPSTTSNACPPKHTGASTHSSAASTASGLSSWSTWLCSARKLLRGIAAMKAGSGMSKTRHRTSQKVVPRTQARHSRANSAEQTHCSTFARSAVRRLRRYLYALSTAVRRAKVVRVVPGAGPQPVFNLTVDAAHCFYANGLLVHNCDTVTQALQRFRAGGFLRLTTDPKDDDEPMYRRRREYY